MLAMVLGQGHRRALRNGAGQGGDMSDWERLTEDCQEIDSSQLFLAIKDLTDQGCNSPALANECSDGWVLAASNVCFSAGGSDVSGHQSCTTTAGTAPEGSSCYFPFVWSQDGGESFDTFNECTPLANSGTPWCSTGPNYALAPDGSDCAAEGTCKWGNCVCEESDSHYGSFNLPRPTPGVRLVHKSGGVSCNRGRGFLSPWGCDLEEDSELGTFITTDCQHGCDTSHIVAPPASRAGGGWWYRPYAENWGNADQLTFQEDHDQEHPQGNFAAGNYQIWYGEDLDASGASQADNAGTACVDVYYFEPSAANSVSCVDVLMIGTASSDFEYSEETVSSMAFDDNLGTRAINAWVALLCASQVLSGACRCTDTWWDGCCEGYPNQQISYRLDRAHLVSGYQFATGDGECPVAWSLEASNDGQNFELVDHQEAQSCHDGDFIVYQME